MNADRARLSVAVLISLAVHGTIASFGDFSAGRSAKASRIMPVAVTIASVSEVEIQKPEPLPQESNTEVAEPARTEVLVPANVIAEKKPPVQLSKSETNPDDSRELSSTEAVYTPPTPKSEPNQDRPNEAAVSISANHATDNSATRELEGFGQAADTAILLVPNKPDVTAVPLYHLIPKPAYPSRSRDLGEEGLVIIAVLVSKDGGVLDAYVSESSGYPLLDGSALATVTEKWYFKPGMRRGNAVSSWVRVPIKFSIKGG